MDCPLMGVSSPRIAAGRYEQHVEINRPALNQTRALRIRSNTGGAGHFTSNYLVRRDV